jgi:hypothetical protein
MIVALGKLLPVLFVWPQKYSRYAEKRSCVLKVLIQKGLCLQRNLYTELGSSPEIASHITCCSHVSATGTDEEGTS